MSEVRTPLAQLQAQHDELVTIRHFWERWGSEWRAVSGVLCRAIATKDQASLDDAVTLYQVTLAAYRQELKEVAK
jgi:hypothetical protein